MNLPEGVATSRTLLQIGSEESLGQSGLDSVEESRLLLWSNSVDAAERKAEKTIAVDVLGKLRGDGGGGFNGLLRGSDATDNNLVGEDVACRAGLIAIGDLPGVALELGAAGSVVLGVAGGLALGSLV